MVQFPENKTLLKSSEGIQLRKIAKLDNLRQSFDSWIV